MRRAIFINISGNDGFTIEFVHTDPHKAQEVANRIATLFIEETIKAREQQVEGAVDFLVTQVTDARRELEKKDEALRRYKEERMGRLPEQLQTNLATMQMLQQELRSIEESLIFAREKRDALARGGGRASAEGLARAGGSGRAGGPAPAAGLAEGPLHRRAPGRAEPAIAHRPARGAPGRVSRRRRPGRRRPLGSRRPRAARAVPTVEVERLEKKRADLEGRALRHQGPCRGHPPDRAGAGQPEARLREAQRELHRAAQQAARGPDGGPARAAVEGRSVPDARSREPAGEAVLPASPPLILGLGAFLGLFAGVGASLVAEFLDRSVKDAQDLETMLSHPVLARIPHLPDLGGPST